MNTALFVMPRITFYSRCGGIGGTGISYAGSCRSSGGLALVNTCKIHQPDCQEDA
jgi:hypothetical protein